MFFGKYLASWKPISRYVSDNSLDKGGNSGGGALQPAGTMETGVGGVAVAAGEDTSASGDVRLDVTNAPKFTVARGSADFEAAAQSPAGQPAAAEVQTDVYANGADLLLIFTRETSGTSTGASGNSAYDAASLRFFALDLKNVTPPGGGIVIEVAVTNPKVTPHLFHGGNYAEGTAAATGDGDGIATFTSTQALTAQNAFSFVDAFAHGSAF